MALLQGYDGKEIHKESGKFVLKSGKTVVGTYASLNELVKANPRNMRSDEYSATKQADGSTNVAVDTAKVKQRIASESAPVKPTRKRRTRKSTKSQ